MDQEKLQKLVEENIDGQVGLDACRVLVSFGIDQIEVIAITTPKDPSAKPLKPADQVKSEMTQEWRDTAKELITWVGREGNLLYEVALMGPTGFTLFLVKGKTYEQYSSEIFKRIEEIKSQLAEFADRDESEWGGSPQDTLDSFIEELTAYVGGLNK